MPNFENASLAEVETAVRCTPQRHHALRLRAIRALGTGLDRAAVAHFCDVSPATVQRWIRAFNQGVIDALLDKPRSGRPRVLSAGRFRTEIVPLLEAPSAAGEHHWTAVKLHGHLAAELQITLGYSTLLRHLREHGWVLRIPRPWPLPPSDDLWHQQRTAFLPGFKSLLSDPLARVFFADEAGFEGDPRPRSTWARKGSHPHNLQTGKHIRLSAIGAVEPATGACSALLCDGCAPARARAFIPCSTTPHGTRPGASTGITSRPCICPRTARTTTPSNASGCTSNQNGLRGSLPAQRTRSCPASSKPSPPSSPLRLSSPPSAGFQAMTFEDGSKFEGALVTKYP